MHVLNHCLDVTKLVPQTLFCEGNLPRPMGCSWQVVALAIIRAARGELRLSHHWPLFTASAGGLEEICCDRYVMTAVVHLEDPGSRDKV